MCAWHALSGDFSNMIFSKHIHICATFTTRWVNISMYVLICPYMSLYVLICPYMSWYVLICATFTTRWVNISMYVLICPYMSLYVVICPYMCWYVLICPDMSLYVLICPYMCDILNMLSEHIHICANVSTRWVNNCVNKLSKHVINVYLACF